MFGRVPFVQGFMFRFWDFMTEAVTKVTSEAARGRYIDGLLIDTAWSRGYKGRKEEEIETRQG